MSPGTELKNRNDSAIRNRKPKVSETKSTKKSTKAGNSNGKNKNDQAVPTYPLALIFLFIEKMKEQWIGIPLILLLSLFVRWTVGISGYSGKGISPMYGDYEAQRHWMEITYHLPPHKWYYYDLKYWGLDYPPLTAFQSWICGFVANAINPNWVALDISRGYESQNSKMFMRATVIAFDYLVYIPGVLLFVEEYLKGSSWYKKQTVAFSAIILPTLVLIDNGHFQYNSVMLGFLVWSLYYFSKKWYLSGAALFMMSILFKQMALFYSPAVFAYLFSICFDKDQGILLFVELGLTVILTCAVSVLPWITSLEQVSQIIIRVFPMSRGLFEDKVANIWCSVNVLIKLKDKYTTSQLARLSAASTLVAFLPSLLIMGRYNLLNKKGANRVECLLYSLSITSLSFFLLSYQVHEKSILLVCLPVILLLKSEPLSSPLFIYISTFTLYPLLHKDGLVLQYIALMLLWAFLFDLLPRLHHFSRSPKKAVFLVIVNLCVVSWHLVFYFATPPKRYPDLFVVANCLIGSGSFVLFYFYFTFRMIKKFFV